MQEFDPAILQQLYKPAPDSHKGQNGKLMIIGGSHLFHAASLWSLQVASRIVDMVFYSSVHENNEIVQKAKEEFRNGIVVPRSKIENYIQEADCILIGPGLPRKEGEEVGDDDTQELTERLLRKYPDKKWVIDGGSLQVISPDMIPAHAILTPHHKEFEKLFGSVILDSGVRRTKEDRISGGSYRSSDASLQDDKVKEMAKKYNTTILLKGETDIVCSPEECVQIKGGNAGMTKGGTGDVLAGLVAGLACKNDLFVAAQVGSYVNKKAAEELSKRVGLYFNASDLALEIPKVLSTL